MDGSELGVVQLVRESRRAVGTRSSASQEPATAALERQLHEFTVLAAMYAGEDEYQPDSTAMAIAQAVVSGDLPASEAVELAAVVMQALDGGRVHACLSFSLPLAYPSAAVRFSFSCLGLGPAAIEKITSALAIVSSQAAAEQREALAELCLTSQQQAEQLLIEAAACSPPPPPQPTSQEHTLEHSVRRLVIWFHHIKSEQKRKEILSHARNERLRGFCKPGFPGVVVVEGSTVGCSAFLEAIRSLKWQVMDIRLDENGPAEVFQAAPSSTGLPLPFVELAENAMGEAAALCAGAGLLDQFKHAILKLKGPSSHHLPSVDTQAPPVAVAAAATAAAAMSNDEGDEADVVHEAVLTIDHMNDRAGYTRLLAKWTQQLGLGGRMFYAVGGGRQARQVVLVLHGLKDGLKAFVQRLRTENVDVNRAGKACKERQSTVVQQGAALTEPRSVLLGWETCEYSDDNALRRELNTLGLSQPVICIVSTAP